MPAFIAPRMLVVYGSALVATMVLFLTMKVLVTGRDYEIDFVRVERDEDVNTKSRAP
ncbi:MAG: hypothetical protein VW981_04465 [Rhodobiaceae bacterium]